MPGTASRHYLSHVVIDIANWIRTRRFKHLDSLERPGEGTGKVLDVLKIHVGVAHNETALV
jgi:hypothetical protein